MLANFIARGCMRLPNHPPTRDKVAWIHLAQHYGLPTRLLDWSLSPLVALFFAVDKAKHHDKDGCLWALQPYALNYVHADSDAILSATNHRVEELINAAFDADAPKPTARVIATVAAETDLRMFVQQAVFTIHSTADSLDNAEPLPDANGPMPLMYKFILPAAHKESLKAWLRVAGISRASLFPDLASLTDDMKERNLDDRRRGIVSNFTVQPDLLFDTTDGA
jgi:hypothetical protein